MAPRPNRRTTGFERPFNYMQVTTWVLLSSLLVGFVVLIAPILPLHVCIPLTSLYLLGALSTAYHGYKCCSTDPVDPRVLIPLSERGGIEHSANLSTTDTKFCWVCETRVGVLSMHCKFCNKCVDHFDHHCQWLNTCVGVRNYKYFYRTVLSACFFLTIHTTTTLGTVLTYFLAPASSDKWMLRQRSNSLYGLPDGVQIYASIIFGVMALLASMLVGQLWWFHRNLQKEGITTYAFIVRDNAKRREAEKAATTLQRRRARVLAQAREEGRHCYSNRLVLGGWCRSNFDMKCCDPLGPEDTTNHVTAASLPEDTNGTPTTDREVLNPQRSDLSSDLERMDEKKTSDLESNHVQSPTSLGRNSPTCSEDLDGHVKGTNNNNNNSNNNISIIGDRDIGAIETLPPLAGSLANGNSID